MMEIDVLHLGIGTRHGDDFVFSRPHGTGAWVFMHLPIPVEIDTADGRIVSAPGDCILHSPAFPQMHRALPGGFHNDWMHFRGRGVASLMRECALPADRLLVLPSTDFVRVAMRELEREFIDRGLHWRRRLAGLTADLFLQLSRRVHLAAAPPATRAERARLPALRMARDTMLSDLARPWTVAALARRVHLSEPRFWALYRRIFGVSPNEDLIRARIDHARFLLAHTDHPVGHVAAACGFESLPYFSRTFRRRVGCAPSEYLRRPARP